ERKSYIELVVEAGGGAGGDVEGAVHQPGVHLEGLAGVGAVGAEVRDGDVEPVGERRAARVELADAFDQAGLAWDDIELAQRRDRKLAGGELDGAAALALKAVERGADVD